MRVNNVDLASSILVVFVGKSLVCKEKAVQVAEQEGQKSQPRTVYFISLVGANKYGRVYEVEGIYDVYTKLYDFLLSISTSTFDDIKFSPSNLVNTLLFKFCNTSDSSSVDSLFFLEMPE